MRQAGYRREGVSRTDSTLRNIMDAVFHVLQVVPFAKHSTFRSIREEYKVGALVGGRHDH